MCKKESTSKNKKDVKVCGEGTEEERRKSHHKDNLLSLHCIEYVALCVRVFVKAVVGKKEWVCSLGDSGDGLLGNRPS